MIPDQKIVCENGARSESQLNPASLPNDFNGVTQDLHGHKRSESPPIVEIKGEMLAPLKTMAKLLLTSIGPGFHPSYTLLTMDRREGIQ